MCWLRAFSLLGFMLEAGGNGTEPEFSKLIQLRCCAMATLELLAKMSHILVSSQTQKMP